jgi:hypothetical protein
MNKALITIFTAVVFVVGALLYIYNPDPAQYGQPAPVACTMDAKLCPDGSYVGRVPPNCEFAQCPQPASSTPIFEDGTIIE